MFFLLSAFEVTSFSTQPASAVISKPGLASDAALRNDERATLAGLVTASTSSTTTAGSSSNPTSTSTLITTSNSTSTSTTFTEISIYNGTSESQEQIDGLLFNGTIPGTIFIGFGTPYFTGYDNFSVALLSVGTSLTINLTAQGISGSLVVLLNISKNSILNVQGGYVNVILDKATVAEVGSLGALLTEGATPSYIILRTSSGFELLLSMPHFSTRTIVVMTPPVNKNGGSSNSGALRWYIVGAAVVVVIVLVVAFAMRNLRARRNTAAGLAN
jgi:hypothetical protein